MALIRHDIRIGWFELLFNYSTWVHQNPIGASHKAPDWVVGLWHMMIQSCRIFQMPNSDRLSLRPTTPTDLMATPISRHRHFGFWPKLTQIDLIRTSLTDSERISSDWTIRPMGASRWFSVISWHFGMCFSLPHGLLWVVSLVRAP